MCPVTMHTSILAAWAERMRDTLRGETEGAWGQETGQR